MAKSSFAVSGAQAPPCDCRKMNFIVLYGEIPDGLNQRYLEAFKPPTEETFKCAGYCTCKKVHNFRVTVNPMNSIITRIPDET